MILDSFSSLASSTLGLPELLRSSQENGLPSLVMRTMTDVEPVAPAGLVQLARMMSIT